MSKQKSMILALMRNVLIILLLALLLGLFVVTDKLAYTYGILLGGAVTLFKIFLMERTFRKALDKPSHGAKNYTRAQYMLRYVITFIVLFIGIYTPSIHFIGLAIGLLALKPAAYVQGLFEPKVPKDGSIEFFEWDDEDDEKSDF